MALVNKCDLTCSCGEKFITEYVGYLFADMDLELKAALLNNSFNSATCPVCGKIFVLDHPFLYRDEGNGLWIEVGYSQETIEAEHAPVIVGHYLDYQKNYRHFKVADRTELITILFREDQKLAKLAKELQQQTPLLIATRPGEIPEVLFYEHKGIQLCQRFHSFQPLVVSETWIAQYCAALAMYNPFSSTLGSEKAQDWLSVWGKTKDQMSVGLYEDFAISFANFSDDASSFADNEPERADFFSRLNKLDSHSYLLCCVDELRDAHLEGQTI
jgi:hypothetical protein